MAVPAGVLASLLATQAVRAAPMTLSHSCLAVAAGAGAPAAAISLASGGSMLTPLLLKTAAAIGLASGVTAIGLGLGGVGNESSPPGASGGTAATQPTTRSKAQSALEAAAAIDAANLPPSEEVIERVLVPVGQTGESRIDLDTGQTYGEDDLDSPGVLEAVDALAWVSDPTPGLLGSMGLIATPVANAVWEEPPAREEMRRFWYQEPGGGVVLDALGELPRTFLFRTEEGAGGILQIMDFTKDAEGSRTGIRLRYKVLVRGEGETVADQVDPSERDAGWTEESTRRASAIRIALQAIFRSQPDTGEWPADLEAAKAAAGGEWPEGEWPPNLPDTLVYVPPAVEPDFPQGPRPVLFEATEIPEPTAENPDPSVIIGWENGSATIVRDPEELNELLEDAGIER